MCQLLLTFSVWVEARLEAGEEQQEELPFQTRGLKISPLLSCNFASNVKCEHFLLFQGQPLASTLKCMFPHIKYRILFIFFFE